MDNCLTCGGLIMEPNTAYGYAGKVCHCYVPPKIQRPASKEMQIVTQSGCSKCKKLVCECVDKDRSNG